MSDCDPGQAPANMPRVNCVHREIRFGVKYNLFVFSCMEVDSDHFVCLIKAGDASDQFSRASAAWWVECTGCAATLGSFIAE